MIAMTATEYKIDVFKRGYTIIEGNSPNNNLAFLMFKIDTDNLRFESKGEFIYDLLKNEEQYIDTLRTGVITIENLINNRHAMNPNNCTHNMIMIGSLKGCDRCMAKFGERMNLDINFN